MPKRTLYFSLLFLIPMLVSLACICSAPAAIPEPAEEIVVQPTEQVATPMPPQETATETTPASETGVALVLIDQHFWSYDPGRVMVSFLLENPSSQVVFTDVEYSISLYDQDRQIIAQRTEIISFIFQNQTVGIVEAFVLDQGANDTASMDLVWDHTDPKSGDGMHNPFIVEVNQHWENNGEAKVIGKLQNLDLTTYTDILVSIICFDANGEISGNGYTYAEIIPGGFFTGIVSDVRTFGDVDSIQLFPTFRQYSYSIRSDTFWEDIVLIDSKIVFDDWGNIFGGFVVRNISNTVLKDSFFHINFYDDMGNIVITENGFIPLLFPGDTFGFPVVMPAPALFNPISKFEILVHPAIFLDNFIPSKNPFSVETYAFQDLSKSELTVTFMNHYHQDASDALVFVLVYDGQGSIIGGGIKIFNSPIPANTSVETQVMLDYPGRFIVGNVEVWVIPDHWTTFD